MFKYPYDAKILRCFCGTDHHFFKELPFVQKFSSFDDVCPTGADGQDDHAFCLSKAKIWAWLDSVSAFPFFQTVWRAPFLIQLTWMTPVVPPAEWHLISTS